MSTPEYNELFLNCQSTGMYHVFTFDIKDSKKMEPSDRLKAQYKLLELDMMMYKTI